VRPAAFRLLAYLFGAAMLGNTLPKPLYVLYQAQWHFSAGIVALVLATNSAAILATLLLAGRAPDQVGRRPRTLRRAAPSPQFPGVESKPGPVGIMILNLCATGRPLRAVMGGCPRLPK
jgi:MFS family permease